MTSTDYYLDNYELQRYGGKTAKKYEEGIVNIIPKAWFFDVGEHIYYGTEYIIYADTIVINEDTMWKNTYWKTEVYVFDIDRTKIGSSQVSNDFTGSSEIKNNDGYNIIIDVAIRNVYYGLDYDKSLNLYTAVGNDTFEEDNFYIYDVFYKLNNKINDYKNNNINEPDNFMSYISEEVALMAIGELLGPYGTIIDILKIVGESFTHIFRPEDYDYNITDYERVFSVSESDVLSRCSLLLMPNNINSLIDNHIYDYSYRIGTSLVVDYTPNNIVDRKVSYKFAFHVQLYDVDGNLLNNGEHDYEFNDSSYLMKDHGRINYLPYQVNILANDYLDNTIVQAQTSGINIIRTAPDTFVMIADIYGRVIANSKNPYGNSEYVIANLEEGNLYYVITGYNNQNKAGSYNLSYYNTPSTLSPNSTMTITNYNDTMSRIYKYTPGSVPCKLNIFTHSYQDTNIAVYNSKGQFIAGNDDAYYDPDEDNSDYNAGCEIGLMTSETYYIIINSVVNESYD